MKKSEIDDIKKLLKDALPAAQDTELQRGLWPAMLRRLDQRTLRVPWWDWALLAGLAAALCFLPGMIPALLYQL
jgi:hypothetical protein